MSNINVVQNSIQLGEVENGVIPRRRRDYHVHWLICIFDEMVERREDYWGFSDEIERDGPEIALTRRQHRSVV